MVTDSRPQPACVVDASVLVKLFVPEDGSESASALLADTRFVRRVVPDLAKVECANVIWKLAKREILSSDFARQSVADLNLLPLEVWPAEELVQSALDLALAHGITVYDAMYVALANRLDCPLVTADAALLRKVNGSRSRVYLLGEDMPATNT